MNLRRIASISTVIAASTGLLLSAATGAHALTGDHLIDQDRVTQSVSGKGQVYGDSYLILRNGRVMHSMAAGLDSYLSGCTAARATYHYADGTTGTQVSERACKTGIAHRSPAFTSSTSKDLVKYSYELLAATDTTAPLTTISGSTYLVGDAPDSFGTKERLDHDEFSLLKNGSRVATVTSDYSVVVTKTPVTTFGDVRSRVSGDLTWSRELRGSYARVYITWHLADGSTASASSDKLLADQPGTVRFDKTSPVGKDVTSVDVWVSTDVAGGGAGVARTRFGDYNGTM